MSKPIVSITNLDNKSAVDAIIDCAGDFFASITFEDIPNLLKNIIDNLKAVGKQVIDKIKDFIIKDFWGLVIDTRNIIKYLLNQQMDKALSCASRAIDKLEKVLDVLSYIPCLSVAVGVILIVVYICQLDFISIASAAICMLGPLKILTRLFPKSRNLINKLVEFLADFGKRFKNQAKTSLKALVKKNKTSSRQVSKVVNIEYGRTKQMRKQIQERQQQVMMKDGTNGPQSSYEISTKAYLYSNSGVGAYISKSSNNVHKVAKNNNNKVEPLYKKNTQKNNPEILSNSPEVNNNAGRIVGYGSPEYKYNDRILGQGTMSPQNKEIKDLLGGEITRNGDEWAHLYPYVPYGSYY